MPMANNGIHATWKCMYDDIPTCTHCGIGAPFARYRKGNGTNVRELTDSCPSCGAIMDKIEQCKDCCWSDDGIKNWERGVCLNCHIGECFEKPW